MAGPPRRRRAPSPLDALQQRTVVRALWIGAAGTLANIASGLIVVGGVHSDTVLFGGLALVLGMLAVTLGAGRASVRTAGVTALASGAVVVVARMVLDVVVDDTLTPVAVAMYALLFASSGYFVLRQAEARVFAAVLCGSAVVRMVADGQPSGMPLLEVVIGMVMVSATIDTLCGLKVDNHTLAEAQQRLAAHDELTGLRNRRGVMADLEALPAGSPLLLVDLDHFKQINDLRGHAAGDEVLAAVARELAAMVRTDDLVARWGGEEFLIVPAHRGSTVDVARLAEQIRRRIADAGIGVTASVGASTLGPDEAWAQALARADRALYRAKAAGRNRAMVAAA